MAQSAWSQRVLTGPRLVIGFTGSRLGLTKHQEWAINQILSKLKGSSCERGLPKPELHHGDCVGSDADMHRLARVHGMKVVLHPADPGKMKTKGLRAWCEGDECLPPQAPLTRNRTIARLCQVMIACPETSVEAYPSGSWHCLRQAERLGKPVVLLPRDSKGSPDIEAVLKLIFP